MAEPTHQFIELDVAFDVVGLGGVLRDSFNVSVVVMLA